SGEITSSRAISALCPLPFHHCLLPTAYCLFTIDHSPIIPYLCTMSTILITGGTGTIGKSLSKFLVEKQHEVIILTRHPRQGTGAISYAAWDPANQTIDIAALQKADYIINLAGAGVADKRWSKKRKQE